ncbi:hypothetical protein BDR06DRAFT_974717 [Suillus hirtellus]|nr:hypothetical protein BDR06DRAFT_974717 [Suillus hirtellus]
MELHWNTILVVAELTTTSYTPSIPARKTLDTKAWLIFREQPWRHFVLSLSFSNNYHELHTKFHSLPDHLPSPNEFANEPEADSTPLVDAPDLKNTDAEVDDVIGQIAVNENIYNLLKVIFCNQGLVGCRTVCYLAQRDGEEFIIEDHWVKGDKSVVLNEVEMLKALKDIPGVPQYVEHCLMEVELGKVDDMQMYCQKIYNSTQGVYRTHVHLVLKPQACPLHEFQTRKELVKVLCDIVLTHITLDDMYSAGGTGTIPFMSVSSLRSMGKLNYQYSQGMKSVKELKLATDHSTPQKMPKIKHTYHDNLESMFYVFTWIGIMFKGPMGEERCLEDIVDHDPDKMEMWLPEQWHGTPEEVTQKAKAKHYFFLGDSMKQCIGEQFAPYFQKLVPLAEEWYDPMSEKRIKHINVLPDEEDSDELLKKAKRLGDGKEEKNDVTPTLSKRTKVEVSL